LVRQARYVLWHDPGTVEALDFRYGIGGAEGAPKAPYEFIEEDPSGTDPKVAVKDAGGRTWVVKFGHEASPDTFCTRLAWALGYYVEPNYYVSHGQITGVHGLDRARKYIDPAGRFDKGRFQLRSKEPKYLKTVTWVWDDNPFLGTPELGGLKVLHMLLSNWDNKDGRDAERRGTNTAIYEVRGRYFYFIDDWGGSMGSWGKYLTRSKWDAGKFRKQSAEFVRMENGNLTWGYKGQHTALITSGIQFSDVVWLMKYLTRVTEDQLRAGLISSGASAEETADYLEGLRARIALLRKLAE
jgi:hypothetical protein